MLIDQTWYQRPAGIPEHVSAGGVVARVEHGRIYLAFTTERDLHGYVLPKGHVDDGETLEQAARREIAEETGLTELTLLDKLGTKARLDFDKVSWKETHYFLFCTAQTHATPTDSHNHDALAWLPLDALTNVFWPEQRELIEEHRAKIENAVKNSSHKQARSPERFASASTPPFIPPPGGNDRARTSHKDFPLRERIEAGDAQQENSPLEEGQGGVAQSHATSSSLIPALFFTLTLLASIAFAQTEDWRKDLQTASAITIAAEQAARPLTNYVKAWREARATGENSTLGATTQAQWAHEMAQLNQSYQRLLAFSERYEPIRKLSAEKFMKWSGATNKEAARLEQLALLLTLLEAERAVYNLTDSLQNAAGNSVVVKNRLNEGNRSFGLQYGLFERMIADYFNEQRRQRTRARYFQLKRENARRALPAASQQRATSLLQDPTLKTVANQSDIVVLWNNSLAAFGATLDPATDLTARTIHNFSQFFGNFVGTNLFRVFNALGLGESRGHALPAFYKYYPHPAGELHGVHPAMVDAISSRLKAGDLLFEKTRFAITDKLIPGYLGHVAIYLESYEALQQLGVFATTEMQQAASSMNANQIDSTLAEYARELESLNEKEQWLRYAIMRRRIGNRTFNGQPLNPLLCEALYRLKYEHANVIEALRDGQTLAAHEGGVTMNPFEHFFYIDDFVATRLREDARRAEESRAQMARFMALALLQYGKPYDFRFDVNTLDAIVCSELAYQSFVDIKFSTSSSFTGASISPDQVAQAAGIATRLDTMSIAPPFEVVEWFEEARPLYPAALLENFSTHANAPMTPNDSLALRAFMAMVREEFGGMKLLSENERQQFEALRSASASARARHREALQQIPAVASPPAISENDIGDKRRLQNLYINLEQKIARAQTRGNSQAEIAALKEKAFQKYASNQTPTAERAEAFNATFAQWQSGAAYRPSYPELYSGSERFFLAVFRSGSVMEDDGFGRGVDLQLAGNHEAPRRSELYTQRYAFLPFHLQFFDNEGKVAKRIQGGAALAAIARYYRQGDYVKVQALDWRNDAYATTLSAIEIEAGGDKGPLSAGLKLMTIGNGYYRSGLYFGEHARIEAATYEARHGQRAFTIASLFYGGRAQLTVGKFRAYGRGAIGVRLGEFGERDEHDVQKDFPEMREWSFGLEYFGASLYRENAHRVEFSVREADARFVQGQIQKDRQVRLSYSWSWDL
ncbi:NUDIX domain-containing protein [candidate division KSB1 bacterium]|nr:NUDIX domain-containing protein [candidate division KSB1 bacterium]